MKLVLPLVARLSFALAIPGLILTPSSLASLSLYDASIAADHDGGAGPLPYAAALTTAAVFDGLVATPFDFGNLIGPATIELIIEGDPIAGGQDGYIGQGANGGNSLRYEQWDDTGTLGFTRTGVADYDLGVASPTEPTHVTYRWDGAGTMDLFIDGALSGTVSGATFEMPMGAGLLGNVSDGGGEGMVGTIHRITTYDSALDEATIRRHANSWLATGDPSIQVPAAKELPLDGSVQSFELAVFNGGQANVLSISMIEIGGADADKFRIDSPLPLNIDPGGQATVDFTFDPMGATGTVAATFTLFSNDLLNDEAAVQISGLIRDPQIAVAAALDFGVSDVPVTEMIEVQNIGASRPLTLTGYEITGPDADKFNATGPASIPAGGSANIEVTFTPGGTVGSFDAQLEIASDDPGLAVALVALSAIEPLADGFLTAYDSVINADHGGGAGPIPYLAVLTAPVFFDTTNVAPFDFGPITGDATFEFILEGDPVAGGQNGYIGQGSNAGNSLRYEQWNDTGTLGFTRSGVADYDLGVPSPTTPTHVAYVWDGFDTMRLFIDGTLSGTVAGAAFEMPSGPGLLGNVADGGNEGMLGTIHRITTYDNDIGADNVLRHALAFTTGAGSSDFQIISIDYDPASGVATFVWNSIPNAVYAVDQSSDLAGWEELDDSVLGEGSTTEYSVPVTLQDGQTKIFFRVRVP